MITGRPRVLVFDRCYHGTVDETMVMMGADGSTLPRPGQIGRVHDPEATTVVVEFNDLPALERALARCYHPNRGCQFRRGPPSYGGAASRPPETHVVLPLPDLQAERTRHSPTVTSTKKSTA
jgi:hypothetical protein